jgi:hypothetical protein
MKGDNSSRGIGAANAAGTTTIITGTANAIAISATIAGKIDWQGFGRDIQAGSVNRPGFCFHAAAELKRKTGNGFGARDSLVEWA